MPKSTGGQLRRPFSKLISGIAATAMATATLVVGGVVTAPPAAAAEPLVCDGRYVYANDGDGNVRGYDTVTGVEDVSQRFTIPGTGASTNALAISGDGSLVYAIKGGNIVEYDRVTERMLQTTPAPFGTTIRGSWNPANGLYYFASYTASTALGVYDPATNQARRVATIDLSAAASASGNGDFAFSASGELIFVVENEIFSLPASEVPVTGSASLILEPKLMAEFDGLPGNGIAFGGNGYGFVSTGNVIRKITPHTGEPASGWPTNVGSGFAVTDMASCSYPNTITLKKDLPGGRVVDTDEFALRIDGPNYLGGGAGFIAATTDGPDTGVQDAAAGPAFVSGGSQFTLSETGVTGADLAKYDVSMQCIDNVTDIEPALTRTGTSWQVTQPTNLRGSDLVCVITNDALRPSLDLRKTSDPVAGTPVSPAETVTYTVEAENTGNTVLDPVTVADDLSDVLDHAEYQGDIATEIDGSTVTSGAATITDDELAWQGVLEPGETLTITYSVVVDDDVEGETLANRVTASGTPPAPFDPIAPPAVEVVHPVPGFVVEKTADPASGTVVAPGDTVTYTVTGRNTGATALDDVTVTDDLSAVFADADYQDDLQAQVTGGTTTAAAAITGDDLSWSGTLNPGGTVTLTYSVIVGAEASGAVLSNTADGEATPTTPDPADPNGPPLTGTPIDPPAVTTNHPVIGSGFTVSKTADPAPGVAVEAGDTVTYTIVGTNTGDSALDPVVIADDLASVLDDASYNGDVTADRGTVEIDGTSLTWEGTLPVDASVTIEYSVTVDEGVTTALLENEVEGTATPQIPTDPSDPDGPTIPGDEITPPPSVVIHPVVDNGFEIAKTSSPESGTAVEAGDTITYTITGRNTGGTVLDPASIDDDLSGVLAAATYNDDVAADLGSVAVVGDDLAWTGVLQPGDIVTITYSVTLDDDATGVLLRNSADGSATPLIPEDPTDPDSPTTPGVPVTPPTVTTEHPVANPGFEITKTVDPASGTAVDPGSMLTYTITGTNTGDVALDPAWIDDDLAEVMGFAASISDVDATSGVVTLTGARLTWRGALEPGDDVEITYSVTLKADAGGEVVRNEASGGATPQLPDDPSDPDSPTTPGEPLLPPVVTTENPINEPGFAFTKTVDPASGTAVDPGTVLTYTLTGVNTGETVLDPVEIVDELGDVLEYATYNDDAVAMIGSTEAGAPSLDGTSLEWTGALQVGETVVITFSVTTTPDSIGQTLRNLAAGTATPPGGDEITPPRETTETPVNEPGFSLSKSAVPASDTRVEAGDVITYTLTGVNTGETALSPVEIVDDMSRVVAHATYNGDATASVGPAPTVSGQTLAWTGELAVGESVEITYSVTVDPDAGGETLTNVVTGSATPPGGVPPIVPPTATTEHPVKDPGFAFNKTVTPGTGTGADPGAVLTYTLSGENTGETVLDPVSIVDDLSDVLPLAAYNGDAAATIGGAPAAAPVVDGTSLTWTGSLQPGERVVVTFTVTIGPDAVGETIRNSATGTATPPGGGELTPPPGTTTTPVNEPGFAVAKSSFPAAGSAVDPGDVITYTVTGINTGATPLVPVSLHDDLSGVLVGAVYNGDAEARIDGELVAGPTVDGASLDWTGRLAVGSRVDITYSVTVDADAGGTLLQNSATGVATPPGGVPPIETPPAVTENPVNDPGFSVTKSVSPASGTAVDPGDRVTYTVTGVNTGETVLDPVSLVDDLSGVLPWAAYSGDAFASRGDVPVVSGTSLLWTGSLGVGERVVITYSVDVDGEAAGETLRNLVTGTATPPGGSELTPPPSTTENPVNVPGFSVSKSVSPAGLVDPGDVVTYTLTGVNTGETALDPVSLVDDLSGVLGSASYNDDAVATIGGADASAPVVSGDELTWRGALPVGATVTVVYSVTVDADAGGALLSNAVVGSATPPGGVPPIETPPAVTENPVNEPGFAVTKTVSPSAGLVDPGDVVTYTVTGVNTGETALDPVSLVDDLSGVLGSASYNDDAVATIGGADAAAPVLSGTELTWDGPLAVGESVVITYSVTVTVNADAGGETLTNAVVGTAVPPGGDELSPPPGVTENPVATPGFDLEKTADPASGTRVATGSVITYTVTGVNTGQTRLDEVEIVDDLSGVLPLATYGDDAVAVVTDGSQAGGVGAPPAPAPTFDGSTLSWTGALEVGETVTITYSVTVDEDAAGEQLENVATGVATPPGGLVITPEPSGTEHPVLPPLAVTGLALAPWILGLAVVLLLSGGALIVIRGRRTTA